MHVEMSRDIVTGPYTAGARSRWGSHKAGTTVCPKYVCVYSCSNYLPFEVCEFPITRHTHPCVAIQWNLVGKVCGQRLTQDHGLVPDHGLVQEISGCLFKSVIFHKSN